MAAGNVNGGGTGYTMRARNVQRRPQPQSCNYIIPPEKSSAIRNKIYIAFFLDRDDLSRVWL